MASIQTDVTSRVLAEVDQLQDELVERVSQAVQIESVNPKYPGQVYEEAVGGEGAVAKFVAKVYEEIECEVDLSFPIGPYGDLAFLTGYKGMPGRDFIRSRRNVIDAKASL